MKPEHYWTILTYAASYDITLSDEDVSRFTHHANEICCNIGMPVFVSEEEGYGYVNSYHQDVLAELMNHVDQKEAA